MPKRKKYPSSLTIRMPGELMEKINKIGEVKDLDKSEVVREILEDYLQ